MAINGKYPTILIGMVDALNSTESARLNALLALKNPNDAQITEINALKAKAEIPSALAPRMPIVLDGEVIKAKPDGYQTTMSKSMQVYGDNTIGTKSTANTVTINIQTKSSKTDVSVFPDIICSVADIIFSKKDSVPRISYFGDNVIIPDGWLVRLSRSQRANSEIETISMEIQKNLETAIPDKAGAKDQEIYETTDIWS